MSNKAYWDALIRGLAWPGQKKKTATGWYVLTAVLGGLLLISGLM
mgnify:CR=1 FL=1